MAATLLSFPASSILAAAGESPGFVPQLGYQAAGMLIVLGALGGLWLAVSVLSRSLRWATARFTVVKVGPASAVLPVAEAPTDAIDPGVVAAISAAVHVTLKRRFQLVSILPENSQTQVWSQEGRREIYQSHRVR